MLADVKSQKTRGERIVDQCRQSEACEQIIRDPQKTLRRRPHFRLMPLEPQNFPHRIHRMYGKPGDFEKRTAPESLCQPSRLCGRSIVVIKDGRSDGLPTFIHWHERFAMRTDCECAHCIAG